VRVCSKVLGFMFTVCHTVEGQVATFNGSGISLAYIHFAGCKSDW
jgi:hypothetical protein